MCLRGGERGTYVGPPFLGVPLSRCLAQKFSSFFVKNSLSTHTAKLIISKHSV